MTLEEIYQIAKNHSHQYGKYDALTGIYKELSTNSFGSIIYSIDPNKSISFLEENSWELKEEAVYSKNEMIFHVFTAIGYEHLIQFLKNSKEYTSKIPSYSYNYENNNENYYKILQFLLEFSLYYGIHS